MQIAVDNQSQTVIAANNTYRIEFEKDIHTYLKMENNGIKLSFDIKVNMQLKDQV